jgi:rubrerythrin
MKEDILPEQNEQMLAWALAAESRAAARGQAFAQKAEQEGLSGWARLLRAAAEAQGVRARRWLLLARGKIGATAENLRQAFAEETQARAREYGRLAEAARQAGEKTLALAFAQAVQVEERLAELYAQAGDGPAGPPADSYAVCQVCGYLAPGQPPARCPVCSAVPEKFKRVE